MSIQFKLLFLVVSTLVLTTISIVFVVNMQFVTVIDESQYALYTEKVDIYFRGMKNDCRRPVRWKPILMAFRNRH